MRSYKQKFLLQKLFLLTKFDLLPHLLAINPILIWLVNLFFTYSTFIILMYIIRFFQALQNIDDATRLLSTLPEQYKDFYLKRCLRNIENHLNRSETDQNCTGDLSPD